VMGWGRGQYHGNWVGMGTKIVPVQLSKLFMCRPGAKVAVESKSFQKQKFPTISLERDENSSSESSWAKSFPRRTFTMERKYQGVKTENAAKRP